ncbi:hypothetical protein AV926_14125 [Myroides marinus]|uniref:Uncharacterized protein n=1 Tax=Myroides marinus TaxID=703342 RepID=A0A163X8Z3_9FLAO|nr:hypothetical protein [Myroides marinus]KZE77507.1 hypothetical protein AV926_14125 [Myroides marinus]
MSTKLGFTFYPKDWWTSETYFTLSPAQRYLFLECLFIMYSNGGYLSNNRELLENRLRTQISESDWNIVTKEFFLEGDNYTSSSVNKRLKRAISNRENGKKGGAPKGNSNAQKQPNQPKKTTQNNPPLEREGERESKIEIEYNINNDKSEDLSNNQNSNNQNNFSDLEQKVFKIWNIYNGKKMSFKIDFENFVEKTKGVEIDFEKLYRNAIPHNKVYFQTWLNKFFPKSQKQVFKKPTIQEIQEYCFERNNQVDPEKFFDHYESNGWMIGGKSKMKDWKAAIRTWEKNSFNNQNQNQNGQQQERFIGRQSIDTIQHNATAGYEAAERVRKQMLNNSD